MTGAAMTHFTPEAEARLDEYLGLVRAALARDPEVSPDEIEADVKEQLQAQSKSGTVTATKTDHSYEVAIASDDPTMGKLDLEVAAPAAAVWSVIVDLDRYPEWNRFVVACRSSLAVVPSCSSRTGDDRAPGRADRTQAQRRGAFG